MNEYFSEMYGESLRHHGVVGMKWGVRRYQDYDGHLIGAKRRNKAITDLGRKISKARESRRVAKEKQRHVNLEELKAKAIRNGDIDSILKLRGQMSTAELKEARERALMLKQIREYKPQEKSVIDKILDKMGTGKRAIDTISDLRDSVNRLLGKGTGQNQNGNQNQQNQQGKKKNKSNNQQNQQNQEQAKEDKNQQPQEQGKKKKDKQSNQENDSVEKKLSDAEARVDKLLNDKGSETSNKKLLSSLLKKEFDAKDYNYAPTVNRYADSNRNDSYKNEPKQQSALDKIKSVVH